jgi:hypothetical protein
MSGGSDWGDPVPLMWLTTPEPNKSSRGFRNFSADFELDPYGFRKTFKFKEFLGANHGEAWNMS